MKSKEELKARAIERAFYAIDTAIEFALLANRDRALVKSLYVQMPEVIQALKDKNYTLYDKEDGWIIIKF